MEKKQMFNRKSKYIDKCIDFPFYDFALLGPRVIVFRNVSWVSSPYAIQKKWGPTFSSIQVEGNLCPLFHVPVRTKDPKKNGINASTTRTRYHPWEIPNTALPPHPNKQPVVIFALLFCHSSHKKKVSKTKKVKGFSILPSVFLIKTLWLKYLQAGVPFFWNSSMVWLAAKWFVSRLLLLCPRNSVGFHSCRIGAANGSP